MYDINGEWWWYILNYTGGGDISCMLFLYAIGDYDDIGGYDLISLVWYCDADYDFISGDDIPCIIWFI